MALTGKQLRFISEYAASPNGTQAAIRAGYSQKTARAIASENLKKPEITTAIEQLRKRSQKQIDGKREQLIQELSKLAFSNIGEIFRDGEMVPPDEWPPEVWHTIKSAKYDPAPGSKNTKRRRVYKMEIKMQDKTKALQLLAECMGLIPQRRRNRRR